MRFVVAAGVVKLYYVEAPNYAEANQVVKAVLAGNKPWKGTRVECPEDQVEEYTIVNNSTFDEFFGDEQPDW